jgi:type IV pilus assembly protein PilA
MTRREDGFTLVELMIVVGIIAMLVAIAIPIFPSFRNRAQDVAAKSNATIALTTAKATITQGSYAYIEATLAELNAAEPSLRFVNAATPSTSPKVMSK